MLTASAPGTAIRRTVCKYSEGCSQIGHSSGALRSACASPKCDGLFARVRRRQSGSFQNAFPVWPKYRSLSSFQAFTPICMSASVDIIRHFGRPPGRTARPETYGYQTTIARSGQHLHMWQVHNNSRPQYLGLYTHSHTHPADICWWARQNAY